MGNPRQNVPIKSVDRSMQFLETLKQHERASVTTLASEMDVAKSTVHNHLRTLQRHGLVARDNDGLFRVGHKVLEYSSHFKHQYDFVVELTPAVQEIAYQTDEICTFLIETGREGVIALSFEGDNAVSRQFREGASGPLHAIPGGKAILAYRSQLRDDVLDEEPLSQITENTLSDPDQLNDELERIVNRGYATNDEEYRSGTHAISVPMIPRDDRIVGALSVVGPTDRLQEPEYAQNILNYLLSVQDDFPVYRSKLADEDEEQVERLSFWTRYGTS